MKRMFKFIIAGLLTFAIAMTGVSVDATTVNAMGITYEQHIGNDINISDYLDTPYTMEIGDRKYFELIRVEPEYWIEDTERYDWSVSDENIVTMEAVRKYATSDELTGFYLVANKAGTATVTGTRRGTSKNTVSMTVVVKGTTTAKQSSCKHKWKTTRKATCLHAGAKTCKKCKAKKTIKRKSHNWVTGVEEKAVCREWIVIECNFTRPEGGWCGMQFSEKEYGSYEAAKEAWIAHKNVCPYEYKNNWTFWTVPEKIGTEKVTVTRCTTCGYTPEEAKQYE